MSSSTSPLLIKKDIEKRLNRKIYFFVDQEGGTVNRLDKRYRSAQYFGNLYTQNPQQAITEQKQTALEMGIELKEKGVDFVFAPTMDISYEKNNFLGSRTYSSNPETVSILATAFIEGMTQAGIIACPKHAPGIGLSKYDTHQEKARITASIEELEKKDFIPFYLNTSPNCLMTGHIFYSAIDEKNVSTFSPKFYQFIRDEFRFNGLIIPDALNMKGLGDLSPLWKITNALSAGADIVLPFFSPALSFQEREDILNNIPEHLVQAFQKKLSRN